MQLRERSAFSIQLSAFCRQLSVVSCQWSVVSGQFSVFSFQFSVFSLPEHREDARCRPTFHRSSFIVHRSPCSLLPAPIATSGTCNVAQKVVPHRPAVTKNTLKQASNERGLLAEVAEVQRPIDFRATLQRVALDPACVRRAAADGCSRRQVVAATSDYATALTPPRLASGGARSARGTKSSA
jgi:hypothetical protein